MKMIRNLFALMLALCLLTGVAMAESTQATATAHKASGITIDGKLDEWNLNDPLVLDGGPVITLDAATAAWNNGDAEYNAQFVRDEHFWNGTDDLSAKVYVAWDEEWLYIGADVTEDSIFGAIEMLPMDGMDNFQLYLSTNPAEDPARTEYATNDFKVFLIIDGEYWDTAFDRNMVPKEKRERFISKGTDGGENVYTVTLDGDVTDVIKAVTVHGQDVTDALSFDGASSTLTVTSSELAEGEILYLTVLKQTFDTSDVLTESMNAARSVSFTVGGRIYILDGLRFLCYDGKTLTDVRESAYIPTTYINIRSGVDGGGAEYMQRNLLSPYFRHTFIGDGETNTFYMKENGLEEITEIKLYGKTVASGYTADLENGIITFEEAPSAPEMTEMEDGTYYPEGYAGIGITAKKTYKRIQGAESEKGIADIIAACRYAAVFDNRVFLSGSDDAPNHIFYCERGADGEVDPTYFGALDYMQDGIGDAPIRALLPVADTLMVLKGDTKQDGTVFFHKAQNTDRDIQPKIYLPRL